MRLGLFRIMTMSYCHYLSGSEAGSSHVSVGPTATAFEAKLQVAFGDCQGRQAGRHTRDGK